MFRERFRGSPELELGDIRELDSGEPLYRVIQGDLNRVIDLNSVGYIMHQISSNDLAVLADIFPCTGHREALLPYQREDVASACHRRMDAYAFSRGLIVLQVNVYERVNHGLSYCCQVEQRYLESCAAAGLRSAEFYYLLDIKRQRNPYIQEGHISDIAISLYKIETLIPRNGMCLFRKTYQGESINHHREVLHSHFFR